MSHDPSSSSSSSSSFSSSPPAGLSLGTGSQPSCFSLRNKCGKMWQEEVSWWSALGLVMMTSQPALLIWTYDWRWGRGGAGLRGEQVKGHCVIFYCVGYERKVTNMNMKNDQQAVTWPQTINVLQTHSKRQKADIKQNMKVTLVTSLAFHLGSFSTVKSYSSAAHLNFW